MFDYIRGIVTYLSGNGIVLEQGGVGYQIICANPFSYQPLQNQETTVFLYQYVREDAIILYGFKSREERELFRRLLSVSGIGPKIALVVLASGETSEIIGAIEAEDNRFLTRFPGIGKKTAGQIILDLKGKLKDFSIAGRETQQMPSVNHELEEAGDALKMLGYTDKEVQYVLPLLEKQELTAENYVKEALRLLMKN